MGAKVTVKFPQALAAKAGGRKTLEMEPPGNPPSLSALLDSITTRFKELEEIAPSARGEIPDHINIYVNGDNVRNLKGIDTPLYEGDEIFIIPALAAG
jgi:molybdopterin converting factor small subunit